MKHFEVRMRKRNDIINWYIDIITSYHNYNRKEIYPVVELYLKDNSDLGLNTMIPADEFDIFYHNYLRRKKLDKIRNKLR
jgi:uncharacterized Fe-S cluster-containing protein